MDSIEITILCCFIVYCIYDAVQIVIRTKKENKEKELWQ